MSTITRTIRRGLFSLSLIPNLMVSRVFERNCKTPKGKSNLLKDFQVNIRETYTKKDALFQVEMWAGLTGQATNNGEEAFNRNFGDLFGYLKTEPGIWHFLRNMDHFNIRKDIRIRSKKFSEKLIDDTNEIIMSYTAKRNWCDKASEKAVHENKPKCILRRQTK